MLLLTLAGQAGAATRATKKLTHQSTWFDPVRGASFEFDFTAALLFPWIDSVQYSVVYDGLPGAVPGAEPSLHLARTPIGRRVVVFFPPMGTRALPTGNVTVHMEVAQCL